jgi:hypothetical protein
MARDVITVEGQDVVVREDTAKAYRFVRWGVTTAAIALAMMAIVFVIFFMRSARDGKVESPAQAANSERR